MDWVKSLSAAIGYMETHMLEPIGPGEVAKAVHISPFYLQKGFQLITGCSISDYIRCRRLYMAAMDLLTGEKIIDTAYKYCYQTPESFAKAFSRFHGFPPSQVKRERMRVKPFLPMKVKISIQGGTNVDYVIEKEDPMRLIGFAEDIPADRGYELCPKFWDRIRENYFFPLWQGKKPETAIEQAIVENSIGMFGVCLEDGENPDVFTYMAVGRYNGGPVPAGLTVREIPGALWAKFSVTGPLPGALQTLNTQIFQEWLPGNPDYELAFPVNLELYGPGDGQSANYESAIWLPVAERSAGHED